jgi:2-polyprenyl-3-methyl-5-hydroxy-6-metoxy-1,4-benzoquinol methylase
MSNSICPGCNNKKEIIRVYKKLNKEGDLLRCKKCGLSFIWPNPLLNEKNYTKEYYKAWSLKRLGDKGLAEMKRATFKRVLDIVSKYKKKGFLLDIGCGFGYLLEEAEKRGWESYGVEVSEYAANKAKERIDRDRIMIGSVMDLSLSQNKFEVITMVDLIEHIYDIKDILKKCRKLLKKEGLLVIVTPDMDSLSHKCMRRYWPHFNEQHVTYFSKRYIKKILDINGFRLLKKLNFKKALNFYYVRGVAQAHCRIFLIFLVKIANILIPSVFKKINFFTLHGEMVVIAQKNKRNI